MSLKLEGIENLHSAMPEEFFKVWKAGTSNPVFVLDEIDKLSVSSQGDPSIICFIRSIGSWAKQFYDNFLEMGYDLSKVMFIATSNTMSSIQPAETVWRS
jgi:ATP-dependent Lon protease